MPLRATLARRPPSSPDPTPGPEPEQESRPAGAPIARLHPASFAFLAVPVVALAAAGWSRRWMADDGFINLRVVDQLLAGNGPVFNAGERVEAATSPLWVALLAVASVLPVRLEWLAVGLGLGLSVAGLVLAELAALRLFPRPTNEEPAAGRRLVVVPAGALVVAALPPFWDFASSGLETGLAFAWIGACCYALAALATGGGRPALAAALVGLGPLIRPDLAVFTVAFLVALLAGRRSLRLAALALGPALAFQVVRMAYYATAVPSPALAKEASRSHWSQGFSYASDLVAPYHLWLPLLALLALAAVEVARADGARRLALAAPVAGGLVHAAYVVRVGGDFMHGRLLLFAVFAVLVPVAAVALRPRSAVIGLALQVAAWSTVSAVALRVDYGPSLVSVGGIADERAVYATLTGRRHPVVFGDYVDTEFHRRSLEAATLAAGGTDVLLLGYGVPGRPVGPVATGGRGTATTAVAIGVTAFGAGTDVVVVDGHGLADPLGARLRLVARGRPGHEKLLDESWIVARFGDPSAPAPPGVDPVQLEAARQALDCGELAEVLDAVGSPLTPSRLAANIGVAFTTLGTRVEPLPSAAAEQLCRASSLSLTAEAGRGRPRSPDGRDR